MRRRTFFIFGIILVIIIIIISLLGYLVVTKRYNSYNIYFQSEISGVSLVQGRKNALSQLLEERGIFAQGMHNPGEQDYLPVKKVTIILTSNSQPLFHRVDTPPKETLSGNYAVKDGEAIFRIYEDLSSLKDEKTKVGNFNAEFLYLLTDATISTSNPTQKNQKPKGNAFDQVNDLIKRYFLFNESSIKEMFPIYIQNN